MSDEYDAQREVVEDELRQFKKDYDKVAANPALYYASTEGDAFDALRRTLAKANRSLALLEKEIRGVRDSALSEQQWGEYSELKKRCEAHKSDLSSLEMRARQAAIESGAVNEEPMNEVQRLGAAVVLEGDTNTRVKETINVMQEVVVMHDAMLESLDRDQERLNRVSNELDGLQADAALARRQLRNVLRSLASNKCMLCVMMIICFVILIISIVDLSSSLKK